MRRYGTAIVSLFSTVTESFSETEREFSFLPFFCSCCFSFGKCQGKAKRFYFVLDPLKAEEKRSYAGRGLNVGVGIYSEEQKSVLRL